MKTLELATDVIAGSTTFAGLSIIYVGAVAASYGSYPPEDQGPLRARFRRRAAMGAIGVGIAASAATLAILGKWAAIQGVVGASGPARASSAGPTERKTDTGRGPLCAEGARE
jgi:hypothetical protein